MDIIILISTSFQKQTKIKIHLRYTSVFSVKATLQNNNLECSAEMKTRPSKYERPPLTESINL